MSPMPTNEATQFFLVMKDRKFRYCVYRVGDLHLIGDESRDESSSLSLDEPLLQLDKSLYPNGMSFLAVGTCIYMVGGYYPRDSNNPFRLSDQTFLYNTLTNTIDSGPTLVSPKAEPLLMRVGSRIYAFSRNIYSYDRKNPSMDPKPRFEVLDTDNLSRGWSPLPLPRLIVSRKNETYSIEVYAALENSLAILITVEDAGTYAFDISKMHWNYVTDASLPFLENAIPIPPSLGFPHGSSLFYGRSLKSRAYSVFCLCLHYYGGADDNQAYQFEEIDMDNSALLSPLPPPEIYHGCSLTDFDPNGRMYSVMSGSDNISAIDTYHGNRYVKIIALDIYNARCKTRHKKKRRTQKNPKKSTQFAMTRIWAKSFYEGPTCHVQEPISAMFAM